MKEEQQISIRLRNEAEINSAKKKGPLGVWLILEACLPKLLAMYENPCDAYGGCSYEMPWELNRHVYSVYGKSNKERAKMRENLVKKISHLLYIIDHAFPDMFYHKLIPLRGEPARPN